MLLTISNTASTALFYLVIGLWSFFLLYLIAMYLMHRYTGYIDLTTDTDSQQS